MDRRRFTRLLPVLAGVPFLGGWLTRRGKPQTDRELKGMGYICIDDQPDLPVVPPKEEIKVYVKGITDAGNWIISTWFGRKGAGHSSFGGGSNMSFPRWVKVYYRRPATQEDILEPLTKRSSSPCSQ